MLDGPWITNTAYLECLLAHNHPIVVAMPQARLGLIGEVTASQPEQAPGKKFYCLPDMQAESHAMVIVGYERCSTKPYFILRDSGQTSPDRHVKYSYDYIRRYARYGVVILNVSDEMNCEPM